MNEALPCFHNPRLIHLAAMFATLSRKQATNNAALRNAMDTRNLARELGLSQFLPNTTIHPTDATMAILATSYAVENMYVPGTISAKVYGHSPFSPPQKGKFPLTSKVLLGIKSCRILEKPVGVVLGKDILQIFNSSLNPEENFYDLLLVSFD